MHGCDVASDVTKIIVAALEGFSFSGGDLVHLQDAPLNPIFGRKSAYIRRFQCCMVRAT